MSVIAGGASGSDSFGHIPRVAALAFNIKGADLLFLDHLDQASLTHDDRAMWKAAGVDPTVRPFGRVRIYVPLADDGVNRHSLRTNSAADVPHYSETRHFALGVSDLWPHLDLLFDNRSTAAANLLAEVRHYFERSGQRERSQFTLAEVLRFFESDLRKPRKERAHTPWEQHNLNTIDAVYQRLHALGATLGGLIDHTGTGVGFDELTAVEPYDLVIIDLERIMADPPDPELADKATKIVVRYVLQRLTEAVTRGQCSVDHVIVFADELNRLAPERGDTGVGEYLAHLARTTRDRGVVLFGAGQFRSGINEDILKAASVHYSMQTPEYELRDPLYSSLSAEVKARLTQLRPGEAMLQFPSFRTPVFARFPRPFVYTGTRGQQAFPPSAPRPLGECIAERLKAVDPSRPPDASEVMHLVNEFVAGPGGTATPAQRAQVERDLVEILRQIEMHFAAAAGHVQPPADSPWERFRERAKARQQAATSIEPSLHPVAPEESPPDTWDDTELD